MRSAIERVLTSLPKFETKPVAKVKSTITLEEMMARLKDRIERQMFTKFSELRANEPERKTVIVGFLAILELFKQGNLIITQIKHFDDIHIELDRASTPKYY